MLNPSKAPSLLKAAGLMAAVLMASKVLGFLRDWAILTVYGASTATDAYFAAVQLPQASIVLLGGLGGPFHTITITVLTRLMQPKNEDGTHAGALTLTPQAKALAATFTTVTGVVFLVLSALCFWQAKPVMQLLLGGNPPVELLNNAAYQLQIMSPLLVIGSVVGILYGALNLLQVYIWPALSPAAFSIAMLVALWLFPADASGHLLAWSTLVGGGLQLLLQVPQYFKKGFTLKPSLSYWKTTELQQLGELLFPALIGTSIGQLTTFVDMAFAAHLPEGGWSAVTLSNRLIQLPIGVLQTALLVPLFPRLSQLAAAGEKHELATVAKQGIGGLWLVIIPSLVWLLFFTEPLVKLVFEHGSFTAEDTAMVTLAFFWQLGSMLPYFARDTLTRVFYAFQDTRTPLLVGLMAIALKALLNWAFVSGWLKLGVGGITFSITLVTMWNALWLAFLCRKHVPNFGWGVLLLNGSKMALAGLGLAGFFVVSNPLHWAAVVITQFKVAGTVATGLVNISFISLALLLGLGVYGVLLYGLKVPEVAWLLKRFKRT